MNVGVDDVVVADEHAEDVHVAFHLDHVDVRVARADPTADDLEAGRQHVDVAERAVGDAAADSEASMDGGVDLAPERAEARRIVDVLNDRDVGRPLASQYSYQSSRGGIGSARRLLGADHAGAGEARRSAAVSGRRTPSARR